MKDLYGRDINYMRVSITDRCDLRCRYCMPEEGIKKVAMEQLLTYEQILRIVRAAAELGISRIKVTGGEPLVRKGCSELIGKIKQIPGIEQVTLTTNGQQLAGQLSGLLAAGLDAVNISMDSLQPGRYSLITRGGDLKKVLGAIDLAVSSGLRTKVNCLLMKGINEDELEDFAAFAFEKGMDVRFIEIMPIGYGDPESGVSNVEVMERLHRRFPDLAADTAVHGNGPAAYYHIPGRPGAVGLISAMHHAYCGSCNRIRLTSQGLLKPCLCYDEGIDIGKALATVAGMPDEQAQAVLMRTIKRAILAKPAGHCFDEPARAASSAMSSIGG